MVSDRTCSRARLGRLHVTFRPAVSSSWHRAASLGIKPTARAEFITVGKEIHDEGTQSGARGAARAGAPVPAPRRARLQRALRFYRDVLGAAVIREGERSILRVCH